MLGQKIEHFLSVVIASDSEAISVETEGIATPLLGRNDL